MLDGVWKTTNPGRRSLVRWAIAVSSGRAMGQLQRNLSRNFEGRNFWMIVGRISVRWETWGGGGGGGMVGVPSRIRELMSDFEVGNRGVAIIDFGISNLKSG